MNLLIYLFIRVFFFRVCILPRMVIMCFNGLMMSWQTSLLIPGGLPVSHEHTDINRRELQGLIENFHNFLCSSGVNTFGCFGRGTTGQLM